MKSELKTSQIAVSLKERGMEGVDFFEWYK